jgi:hypothetical protein
MARDRQSWYITFGGLLGVDEIWQTGVHCAIASPSTPLPVPVQDDADAMWNLVKTFVTTGSNLSREIGVSWARIARQNTSGAEMEAAVVKENPTPTPAIGPLDAPAGPFSHATVLSLRSGSTFGRANYGRCYIPGVISSYENGYYGGTNTQEMATQFRTLINGINNYLQNDVGPLGISTFRVYNLSSVGTGTSKPVTSVWVGSVPDTQRRRRNNQTELYTQFPVTG